MSINVHLDEKSFTFHRADLEHLDEAMLLLRKGGQYTAAERVGVLRSYLAHTLDEEGGE